MNVRTDECLFVQPKTWRIMDEDFSSSIAFARQMAQMVEFVDEKQAKIDRNYLWKFTWPRRGFTASEEIGKESMKVEK